MIQLGGKLNRKILEKFFILSWEIGLILKKNRAHTSPPSPHNECDPIVFNMSITLLPIQVGFPKKTFERLPLKIPSFTVHLSINVHSSKYLPLSKFVKVLQDQSFASDLLVVNLV